MLSEHAARLEMEANRESEALQLFTDFVESNAELLQHVARLGDGRCGTLILIMQGALLPNPSEQRCVAKYKKAVISASLRTAVFERDAYRCVQCNDHHDLTCDHIKPESLGGETALENLQTMCRPCNSRKGITFAEGVA